MPLTAKREVFCHEYQLDSNGTQAAIRAGYSAKTANEQAARLLANVNVKQEISRIRAGLRVKHVADRVERQEFWTDTMKTAPNMSDRLRASELLGKSQGDFWDLGLTAIVDVAKPVTAEQVDEFRAMARAATKLRLAQ